MSKRALTFCEREAELERLMTLYNSITVDSGPRIAIISGERGTGKTRLALEFYRRLSAKESQEYWPDADFLVDESLELNPPLDQCRFNEPMPFLWWGIRAPDPDVRGRVLGDAVADHHEFLAHHLVPLMVNVRRMEMGWSLAKTWAEFGVSAVASLLQIDTVLSIGEKLLDSVRILHAKTDTLNVAAGIEQATLARTTAIINDLSNAFSRRKKTRHVIPMVILIDDAQFSHLDPSLMGLISELLLRAELERWPLLVIATHWQRELGLDAKGDGKFARLLRSLSPVWGSERLLPLTALTDLGAALRNQLPGLTSKQHHLILDRAGGNPRFLEQIVALSKERISYFIERDRSLALSERGLKALLEKSVDIERVIEERLFGAPEVVREALACASSQGMRFSKALNEAVVAALTHSTGGDGLALARDPYALVLDAPGQSDHFGMFSEKLFYRAILDLREDLPNIPDGGEAFDEALRAALIQLVADKSSLRGYDSNYPLEFFCELGINVFDRDTPTDLSVVSECLATLASIDFAKGNVERMNSSLEQLATMCRDRPAGNYFRALLIVFSVTPWIHEHCAANVLPVYVAWLTAKEDEELGAFDQALLTALMSGWNGYILSYSGNAEKTRECFSQCLDALGKVYEFDPSIDIKMVIANAYFNMGGEVKMTSVEAVVDAPRIKTGMRIARDIHAQLNSLASGAFLLRGILSFLEVRNYEAADLDELHALVAEARNVIAGLGGESTIANSYSISFKVPEAKILVLQERREEAEDLLRTACDRLEVMKSDASLEIHPGLELSIYGTRMQNLAELIVSDNSVDRDSVEKMRANVCEFDSSLFSSSERLVRISLHLSSTLYDYRENSMQRALAECTAGLQLLESNRFSADIEGVIVFTHVTLLLWQGLIYDALERHADALESRMKSLSMHEAKWKAYGELGSFKCHVDHLECLDEAKASAILANEYSKSHALHIKQLEVLPHIVTNQKNAKLARAKTKTGLESCIQASTDGSQNLCLHYLENLVELTQKIFEVTKSDEDNINANWLECLYAEELVKQEKFDSALTLLERTTSFFLTAVETHVQLLPEARKSVELLIHVKQFTGDTQGLSDLQNWLRDPG